MGLETVNVSMNHLRSKDEGIIEVFAESEGIASYLADLDNYYCLHYNGDFLPYLYIKKINQKGYEEDRTISYNQINGSAYRTSNVSREKEKKYKINYPSRDFFSALFYLRFFEGNECSLFLDVASVPWECFIKKDKNEKIKILGKEAECRKFKISFKKKNNRKKERTDMLTNNLVKEENDLYFWITDDERRIPVRAEYKMLPFSVYWNLKKYEEK